MARAPFPMPRTARPGGYPAAPTAFWDKPGFKQFAGNALSDLGYGLTQGKDFGQALGVATERGQQMQPYRTEQEANAAALAKAEEQKNETLAYLQEKYPDIAAAVAGGLPIGDAYNEAFKRQAPGYGGSTTSQPASVQEYQYYANEELKAGRSPMPMEEWMGKGEYAGGVGSYGQTVMLGRDADQNPVPLRANPSGGLSAAPMPDGITFDPGGMAGERTTSVVDAKTSANARAMLPGAEQAYAVTQQALTELASPAGKLGQLDNFGKTLGIPNNQIPFTLAQTPKANFENIVNQLSGQSFVLIREALKGAGQVTDFEGMKGEQAISRMRDAAAKGDSAAFNRAVSDYVKAMENGMRLLREQANGGYVDGAPAVTGGTPGGNTTQTGVPWSIDP